MTVCVAFPYQLYVRHVHVQNNNSQRRYSDPFSSEFSSFLSCFSDLRLLHHHHHTHWPPDFLSLSLQSTLRVGPAVLRCDSCALRFPHAVPGVAVWLQLSPATTCSLNKIRMLHRENERQRSERKVVEERGEENDSKILERLQHKQKNA